MIFIYANHYFGLLQALEICRLEFPSQDYVTISPGISDDQLVMLTEARCNSENRWIGHIQWNGLIDKRRDLRRKLRGLQQSKHTLNNVFLISQYNYGRGFEILASEISVSWNNIILFDDGIGNSIKIKNKFRLLKSIFSLARGAWRFRPERYRLGYDDRQKVIYTVYEHNSLGNESGREIKPLLPVIKSVLGQHGVSVTNASFGVILPTNEINYRKISKDSWIERWESERTRFEEQYGMPFYIKYKWDDLSAADISKKSVLSPHLNAELFVFHSNCKLVYTANNSTYALACLLGLEEKFKLYGHKPHAYGSEKEAAIAQLRSSDTKL